MEAKDQIEAGDLVAQARRIKARAEELLRDHRQLEAQAQAQATADRLARMTPQQRLKWKTSTADVRQHTRDEERRERQARMRGDCDLIEKANGSGDRC